jgi:hypothetical protein
MYPHTHLMLLGLDSQSGNKQHSSALTWPL